MFASTRSAMAYCFAAQRGPQRARPRRDDGPRGTGHDQWVHVLISTLLYASPPEGCGVERDSELDLDVRAWAAGGVRTPAVRNVEIAMRRRLREHGLQAQQRGRLTRLRFEGFDARTLALVLGDHLVVDHEREQPANDESSSAA